MAPPTLTPFTRSSVPCRLVVSDGQYYMQAMLATQLNDLVTNNELQKFCVVRLDEYICNSVQDRK